MKKWLALMALTTTLTMAADDEFGIGLIVNLEGANDINVAVKYNTWMFDIGGNGIAADKLFVEKTLTGDLGWFLGLGAYTNFNLNAFGARIPIGIEYELSNNFDIFALAAFGYSIEPNMGDNGMSYKAGLRYFF